LCVAVAVENLSVSWKSG